MGSGHKEEARQSRWVVLRDRQNCLPRVVLVARGPCRVAEVNSDPRLRRRRKGRRFSPWTMLR